jgi:hypothetical protein
MTTGIRRLHSKGCPARDGRRCRCGAGWEASAYSRRDRKKIRKTFAREAEAKSWRADAVTALERGALRAPKPTTVEQAWGVFYEGVKAGTVRNRSGERYKPSAIRSYEKSMRLRVLPEFGPTRLSDVRRIDIQDFVDGASRWAGLLHDPYHPASAPGDLPSRPCPWRRVGEPLLGLGATHRPGPSRPLRFAGRGRGVDRRRPSE